MLTPNLKEERIRTNEEVPIIYLNDEISKNTFKNKKFFIKTYGCQMNVHDSEEIKAHLNNLGLEETEDMNESDFVILNTCAIRENAQDKVYGYLGRCKHLKEIKPNLMVIFCGCMAQEESVINKVIKEYPFIDIVLGTHNLYRLPELILSYQNKQVIEVLSNEGKIYENLPYQRDSHIKAWVNIMYGCDKFCTYCIVPYTRGKERSRKKEDILKEVSCLKEAGYQEITLLGQNVNAYGHDLKEKISFAELLEEVAKTNIPRIRFVTSHPWNFTDEMIDVIANYSNIMPYIHLPLQSGSDRILKLMGRRYTKEEYLNLFNKMKERIPNVSITTDIIVGFPSETEEDFNETLDVVNICQFDGAFTFMYSPRIGTPAAIMKDQIEDNIKEERLQRLNKIINSYSLKHNQEYLNKVVPVLIEGVSEKDNTKVMGYTDTMKLVNVEANKDSIGKIINVKITETKSFSLDGIEVK